MTSKKILEIACFNLESALIAQAAGADRIELCENYDVGGNSPSVKNITTARERITIPLHVIIRPRPEDFGDPFLLSPAHDFNYNEIEIQWMIQYIRICRFTGMDGIVFGALTKEKEIDITVCTLLIEAADSMPLTFHRAIDQCADMEKSIRQLIDLGVKRVLTSGGRNNAAENSDRIRLLQTKFGKEIIIMPGGGLRSSNIHSLISTGCNEFHTSAITGTARLANVHEIKKLKQFLTAGR